MTSLISITIFMKSKSGKAILVTLGVVLFWGLLTYIIVINQKRQKLQSIITIPTSLAYVLDESQNFTVDIWLSNHDSVFLTPEVVSFASLMDEDSLDEYQVELKKITIEDEPVKLDQAQYFPAKLTLHFPFTSESQIILKEAKLNITIGDGTKLPLPLGSISFYQNKSRKAFLIKQLRGLTGRLKNQTGLAGVVMQLSSLESEKVNIINIQLINASAMINYDYTQNIEIIPETRNMADLIGEEIPLTEKPKINSFSLAFEEKQTNTVVLPFSYFGQYLTEQAGFIIHYEYLGKPYQQIIEPITLLHSFEGFSQGVKVTYDPN